jgi:hypothetical protein
VAKTLSLFALYLMRMAGVGSFACWLTAIMGWVRVWGWTVKIMTAVTMCAHGFYILGCLCVCLFIPCSIIDNPWSQQL